MSAIILFAYPLLAIALILSISSRRKTDLLVLLHALLHGGVGIHSYVNRKSLGAMDDLGLFVFLIVSVLYSAISVYRLGFHPNDTGKKYRIHSIFLMIFIMAMDGATMVSDLGLIWIFVEATTIASALLVNYSDSKSSLEAAWKYLFICSVGIAIAFAGILLLIIAQPHNPTLHIAQIDLAGISPFWLKISFVFILVGFGTKVGLAPLHFWLPDAHSEAPAPVSALLSGALLNIALIPVLRMDRLMQDIGMGSMTAELYLLMGFISIFTAAVFILKTKDFKRILAYSSIENMGIIMIALGTGGIASKAGYLHILGHSLIKGAFFLVAGNALLIFQDKNYENLGSLSSINRVSGWLWMLCTAMIIGMPPSPLFSSKFLIATTMLRNGAYLQFTLLMLLLLIVSWGMLHVALKMHLGDAKPGKKLSLWLYLAPAGLLLIAAVLGIFVPVLD